jgi:hypothetical protein
MRHAWKRLRQTAQRFTLQKRCYRHVAPVIDYANQFTNLSCAQAVHDQYKPAETEATIDAITMAGKSDMMCTITDIGGSNGRYLLTSLNARNIHAHMHVIEPDAKELSHYQTNIQQYRRISQGQIYNGTLQSTTTLPHSDVMLCSHSLYYTKPIWHLKRNNLFQRILGALSRHGIWVAALQSDDPNRRLHNTPLLKEVEDFSYPIRSTLQGMPCRNNEARNTYATSSMLLESLHKHNPDLQLSIQHVASHIRTSDDPSPYLHFYSGGLWGQFTSMQQRSLSSMIANGVTHATDIISIRKPSLGL